MGTVTSATADEAAKAVGKRVTAVVTTNTGTWYDPDGFIITFDDGTKLEVSADMGQGCGYVLVDWLE